MEEKAKVWVAEKQPESGQKKFLLATIKYTHRTLYYIFFGLGALVVLFAVLALATKGCEKGRTWTDENGTIFTDTYIEGEKYVRHRRAVMENGDTIEGGFSPDTGAKHGKWVFTTADETTVKFYWYGNYVTEAEWNERIKK